MLMVGGTAALESRFTIDGVLANPDAVTGRVKKPDDTIVAITPVSDETGVWTHALALDQHGTYAWEMTGTGAAAGTFGDTFTVAPSVIDGPGSGMHLISTGDVAVALGRDLTGPEADRAEQLIPQIVALLERVLNRTLVQRQFTDERHVIAQDRHLLPFHGPVAEMISMRFGEVTDAATTAYNVVWREQHFAHGQVLHVTYLAGEVVPDPQVQGIVGDAVAGALLAGPAVATGAISSYSVEGTSISYGAGVSGGGGAGRVTVADLTALRGMKRLVWR